MFLASRIGIGGPAFIACKDGYIVLGNREEYQWRAFMEEVIGADWTQDVRLEGIFPDPSKWDLYALVANWESRLRPIIEEWAKKYTKQEIFEIAQRRGIPIAPCNTVAEVLESPQLKEREAFVKVDHPETGKLIYPRSPLRLDKTPCEVRCPAPRLGQHNDEILRGRLGYPQKDLVKLREGGAI